MYFVAFLLMLLLPLTPIAMLLWVGFKLAFAWEVPMPSWLRTFFITLAAGWGLSLLITLLVLINQSTWRPR
jgi:hypothetical protein